MAAKFELYKDKSGEFRFRLKAGNGEVIATSSESYKTKAGALNGIESIKKNAATRTSTTRPTETSSKTRGFPDREPSLTVSTSPTSWMTSRTSTPRPSMPASGIIAASSLGALQRGDVDQVVAGQELLGLQERPVGHRRDAVADLDHRRSWPARPAPPCCGTRRDSWIVVMNFSCPLKMACCSASVSADRTSGLMFRTTRYFTSLLRLRPPAGPSRHQYGADRATLTSR